MPRTDLAALQLSRLKAQLEYAYAKVPHLRARFDAARVTPQGPTGADTYLFLGDSFIFGQGLPDDETLAAQFVKANGGKVRAVNLGVPGNAPNHLVRAFEAGLLDHYATQPIKAVVSWIIPAQLARVTGDGSWLGSSPRYVLENGVLRQCGRVDLVRDKVMAFARTLPSTGGRRAADASQQMPLQPGAHRVVHATRGNRHHLHGEDDLRRPVHLLVRLPRRRRP
jgi:hypothetical protein